MRLISTVTVGAGGSPVIQFTSIPQTYTDLLLVVSGRADTSSPSFYLAFGAATYTTKWMNGTGSASVSGGNSGLGFIRFDGLAQGSNYTASTFMNASIYIPNYASTTIAKSISADFVTENNAADSKQTLGTSVGSGTAAITSIDVDSDGNWVQYSTASLYGITRGNGGATVA